MLSREYNKRFQFWQTTAVPNDFAGHTMQDAFLFSSWGKISTNGVGYKFTDFGLDQFNNPFLIQLRFRKDFDYNGKDIYMLYKNQKYVIKGSRNVNEAGLLVDLFCVKAEL